jgi:hypothetical protein
MFNVTAKLNEFADVLEKVAQVFEEEELKVAEERAETVRRDYIEPIKQSGLDIPKGFETKLAALGESDPDLLSWIKKSTTSNSSRAAEDFSLGGPSIEKNAHEESDPLLAFCLSDD